MKKSRFTDSQVMEVLKRVEAGLAVPGNRHQLGDVLQMAGQVRRAGLLDDQPHEGTGAGERPA